MQEMWSDFYMTYKDKTFCASPNCKNDCKRQMTFEEKEEIKELVFQGFKLSGLISYGYFCGEPENDNNE